MTDPHVDQQPVPLGAVVGENMARIRKDLSLTQHEAARRLGMYGLRWGRSTIAAFESGARTRIDLGEVLALAMALDVHPAELLDGDGWVEILPGAPAQEREDLREFLGGEGPGSPVVQHQHSRAPTEADNALADRLGEDPQRVWQAAVNLWGHSLTEERDRRVEAFGPLSLVERKAHRGHVTRELAEFVAAQLADTEARVAASRAFLDRDSRRADGLRRRLDGLTADLESEPDQHQTREGRG